MTASSTTTALRSERFNLIEHAAIDAWVAGEPISAGDLAERIGDAAWTLVGGERRIPSHYLRMLAERGIYQTQGARVGSKGDGPGHRGSPQVFNFTEPHVDPDTVSFATAVEHYLHAADVTAREKADLRSAVRFHFALPTKCPDRALVAACSHVPCAQMARLPERLFERATAAPAPIKRKTAKNFRSCVRACLRRAAVDRVVPLVFPRFEERDEWYLWKERYFPLAVSGPTPANVTSRRSGWNDVARACKALFGDDISPEQVSRAQAIEGLRWIQHVDGRGAARGVAHGTLTALAREHGVGPFTSPTSSSAFETPTPRGPLPSIYLRDANDSTRGRSWESFLELLRAEGFAPELIEFLEWYGRYITLNPSELAKSRAQYPRRRPKHHLKAASLAARAKQLRAFLGAAVNEVGMSPAECCPAVVFGTQFELIANALVDWWGRRAATLPASSPGKAMSGGLRDTIIGSGMVAYTLYERLRHARKLKVSVRRVHTTEALDEVNEEAAEKTKDEQAVWDAYVDARALGDYLHTLAGCDSSARGGAHTEFKDIRRIIEVTPPSWWLKLHRAMLEEWRARKRRGDTDSHSFHVSTLVLFELGAYISTGCRNEELCIVRLDEHAAQLAVTRTIVLRKSDRKNGRHHEVLLQEAFVPDDLLSEMLDRARPFLMRPRHPRVGNAVEAHPYLLLNERGRAYGGPSGRDDLRLKERVKRHGVFIKRKLAAAAVRFGMTLPSNRWEFGLHCIRGACGYGIYVTQGRQAAAHYLGDSEDTVAEYYSAIDGKLVDSSMLIGVEMGPRLSPVPGPADRVQAGSDDYAAALERLLDRFGEGLLDRVELDDAKQALRSRFRCVTPSLMKAG